MGARDYKNIVKIGRAKSRMIVSPLFIRENGCYKSTHCSTYIKILSIEKETHDSIIATVAFASKTSKRLIDIVGGVKILKKQILHWEKCSKDESF